MESTSLQKQTSDVRTTLANLNTDDSCTIDNSVKSEGNSKTVSSTADDDVTSTNDNISPDVNSTSEASEPPVSSINDVEMAPALSRINEHGAGDEVSSSSDGVPKHYTNNSQPTSTQLDGRLSPTVDNSAAVLSCHDNDSAARIYC